MALYTNTQQIDPARMAYLRQLAEQQTQDAAAIRAYRDYYIGDHPTSLTQRQKAFLALASGQTYCENYCTMVVDSLAERLTVTGFTTGDEAADALLWEWWQAGRMDGDAALAHTYACRDGASYVIVSWNNEERRPEFHVNEAYDGDEGVKVFWQGKPGPKGSILFASKRWREDTDRAGQIETLRRFNLYLPGVLEKYRSGADASDSGWQRFTDEESDWPIAWLDTDGQPLGIPVVPFLNKRTGVSELVNVLPIQDAINKTAIDIMAAADVEGFGIYFKTGGQPVASVKVFPGAFWQDTDPQAQFGKLAGSQLTGLLEAYEKQVRSLAVVTRRPLRYFTGGSDDVSGESKKQDEAGLVAQAKDATVHFGNSWENVMYLAAKLDRVFGDGRIPEDVRITCRWADVEVRNEEAHAADVILRFEKGVIDQQQAWDELGYSREVQDAMLKRAHAKQAQALANAVRLVAAQPATVAEKPEAGEEEEPEEGEEGETEEAEAPAAA